MNSIWQFTLINASFLFAIFAIGWAVCKKINNYGYVDFIWSASFSIVALSQATISNGWWVRRLLFAGMVCFWSWRLASHLFTRLTAHHPHEDVRYVQLRKDWAANLNTKFFLFFLFQAVTVILLTLPFSFVMASAEQKFSVLEYLGVAIWFIALIGETTADRQLKNFKKSSSGVCDVGLWKYSRHPNYFFEWLIWVGYSVFALASPMGWITIYSPCLMFFFLVKMTGIPITEDLSVKKRGETYVAYQRKTSMFFPWPPKRS